MLVIGMAVAAVAVRHPVTPVPAPVTVGNPIVAGPVMPAIITAPGIVAAGPVTGAMPAPTPPIPGMAVVRRSPIGAATSIPRIGAAEGESGSNPGGNTRDNPDGDGIGNIGACPRIVGTGRETKNNKQSKRTQFHGSNYSRNEHKTSEIAQKHRSGKQARGLVTAFGAGHALLEHIFQNPDPPFRLRASFPCSDESLVGGKSGTYSPSNARVSVRNHNRFLIALFPPN